MSRNVLALPLAATAILASLVLGAPPAVAVDAGCSGAPFPCGVALADCAANQRGEAIGVSNDDSTYWTFEYGDSLGRSSTEHATGSHATFDYDAGVAIAFSHSITVRVSLFANGHLVASDEMQCP